MALLEGTIAIVLYIVLILIIFKLVRSIIKTVLLALLLVLAVVGVGGFLIISDFNDLRHNFGNSSKTIYLVDGNNLLAGYSFVDLDSDNMDSVGLEELESLEESLEDKDYNDLLKEDYKIFLIELSIFNKTLDEGIKMEMEGNSIFLEGENINKSLYSSEPLAFMYDQMFESMLESQKETGNIPESMLEDPTVRQKLKDQFFSQVNDTMLSPGQGRAMIFSLLFKEKITGKEGLKDLYMAYREGDLMIHKETAFFKLIKYLPFSLVEKLAFEKEVEIKDEI